MRNLKAYCNLIRRQLRPLSKSLTVFSLGITCTFSAQAYDVDSHFYLTYAIARYSGINHNISSEIALGAQWMDESLISSPVEVTSPKQYMVRYLFHFPGYKLFAGEKSPCDESLINNFSDIISSKTDLPNGIIFGHDINVIVKPNEVPASQMIQEGFRQGDLIMASAGLHILQDSFSHAGYNALLGHLQDGHNPDRPYTDWPKYKKMITAVFKTMVNIRELLPKKYIDINYKASFETEETLDKNNYQLNARVLSQNFIESLEGGKGFNYNQNFLLNPEYTYVGVKHIIENAFKKGMIKPVDEGLMKYLNENFVIENNNYQHYGSLDELVVNRTSFGNSKDIRWYLFKIAYQLIELEKKYKIENNISSEGSSIFNLEKIYSYINAAGVSDYVKYRSRTQLINEIIDSLTKNEMPKLQSNTNKSEFEIDNIIWKTEMKLRVREMRKFIFSQFGENIKLVGINEQGNEFLSEKLDLTLGSPIFISKNLKEQKEWNEMIYNYMYPESYKSWKKWKRIKEYLCSHEKADGDLNLLTQKSIEDEYYEEQNKKFKEIFSTLDYPQGKQALKPYERYNYLMKDFKAKQLLN